MWGDGDLYDLARDQTSTSDLRLEPFDPYGIIDGHDPVFGRINADECDDIVFHRVENAMAGSGWLYTVLISEHCALSTR